MFCHDIMVSWVVTFQQKKETFIKREEVIVLIASNQSNGKSGMSHISNHEKCFTNDERPIND